MVRIRWWRRAATIATALVALAACGASGDDAGSNEEAGDAERMPDVSVRQAGEVISDAMLITSQALYLAIARADESREVATEDRALVLNWSDEANFLTGVGRYEVALDGYAIPENDPFAEHYHGYVFTGSIVLESPSGEDTAISFDLEASHPTPDTHPGRSVTLDLGGPAGEGADRPRETVLVNGREFSFEELSASF